MKETKTIELNVNGTPKKLTVEFDYIEELVGSGKLHFNIEDSYWQYYQMNGYENQADAINGFCETYWGEKLVAIN